VTIGDGAARRLSALIFSAMAVAMPVLSGGVVWALAVNKDQSDQLKAQLAQIQAQRVENTRDACEKQNADNARIESELLKLVPRASAEQRRTIAAFADAVALPQDCDVVVRERTGHK